MRRVSQREKKKKKKKKKKKTNTTQGIPATQSLQHISASARSSQGKKGGVSRIAYLTALAPALGESLTTSISGGLTPTSMPPMDVDQVRIPPHSYKTHTYHAYKRTDG
jgi:hypothetical protein